MNKQAEHIAQLFSIRNQYGAAFAAQKKDLLHKISVHPLKNSAALTTYHDALLFLQAFPDDKVIYNMTADGLNQLEARIQSSDAIQWRLFNSGITGTQICGAFGFELVKWLRSKYGKNVTIDSISAEDGQITYILSAVMPQVESEILQDANTTWKKWTKAIGEKDADLLDRLIAIFDQSEIRPEVKDELWSALSIDVTVNLSKHTVAPAGLTIPYYHKVLIKKASLKNKSDKPVKVKLQPAEAEQILESGRMILVRNIREIDPISFSDVQLVSYYQLARGYGIALYGMTPNRRHPIDSYYAYVVFKNGLPVSYGGSWVLLDSCRIALNVFAPYRGGESMYIFEQILKVHRYVFNLKRFVVDPYQIGKENEDGIKSGSFWVYHKLGFKPIQHKQQMIAAKEAVKMKTEKGYRSSAKTLKELANSKLELNMEGRPAQFDAADLSIVYANIVARHYLHDRKEAERFSFNELIKILKPGRLDSNENLKYILKNWCVLLATRSEVLRSNKTLCSLLNKSFRLKAEGDEEACIRELQRSADLRKLMEGIVAEYL